MDAGGAALPEFEGFGDDLIATPEVRWGDFLVLEAGFEFEEAFFEDGAGGDFVGLV